MRNRGGCANSDTSIAIVHVAKTGGVDMKPSTGPFNEAKLLELAHKDVHMWACGPDHFSNDLLRKVRQLASARTPLVAVGKYEQQVRQALLARIQELFGQIGFETDVARKEMPDESIPESRLRMEQPNHGRLRDDEHLRGGHRGGALPPLATAGERPLTQERAGPKETADRLLAAARRHGQPHPTALDVHHAVAWVTLAEDVGPWSVIGDGERRRRRLEQGTHSPPLAVVLGLHRRPPIF